MVNIAELINEYCEDEGLECYGNYSGKGMYERNCIGIVCDNPLTVLSGLFAYIIDSDDELEGHEIKDMLGKPHEDQMGVNHILYFPKLRMC